MAAALNLRSFICRHLLHPSAAAAMVATSKNLLPTQSLNLFLLKSGGIKTHGYSSNAYLPRWPLGSSLMQIGAARTYATKGDHNYADPDGVEASDDDDEIDDDDIENYSGSDFDDEDEYEDLDEDPDL